jgi:hypothetical protein
MRRFMNRVLASNVIAALAVTLVAGPGVARQRRRPVKQNKQLPQQIQFNRINQLNNDNNFMPNLRSNQARAQVGEVIHEAWDGQLTARNIRAAIDDGLLFLRSQQGPDGRIGGGYANGGSTGLAALALLAAGAHPITDPELSRALAYLESIDPDNTYVRGIRANVWEYALRKVPSVDRWRTALKADFDWLLAAVNDEGWRYNSRSTDWDNSCTQYGVLGIWAGQRAGFTPPDAFWAKMSKHFQKVQSPDGGWSYTTGGSSANMATAGLASTFLVFDMLHGKAAYSAEHPRTFADGPAAKVLESIERGMDWLGKQEGRGNADSYYLYGIERTGVASGRKYIGGMDWFREGATTVLKLQAPDGSMALARGPVIGTALSTLFLVYGGAPVAYNKLQWGDGQVWNLNPRDLANVSRALWTAYERPLNWHTVSIKDPVEEYEAPVLFISGAEAWTPSDAQVDKLRTYIQRGGTILAEPSDRSVAFKASMRALAKRMYPLSQPGEALQALQPDHGIYTVLKQDWRDKARPALSGVEHGGRTVFFLSEGYLSGDWQRNDLESDAFRLSMNLLFYATDLATMRGRFSTAIPATKPVDARGTLQVGVVGRGVHALSSWTTVTPWLKHVTGVEVQPRAAQLNTLKGLDVLHLSGRGPLNLTADEMTELRRFVMGGGTLVVDAWAGEPGFASNARKAVEEIFGALKPLPATDALALGQYVGGSDLTRGVRLKLPARRALRRAGKTARGQHLEISHFGTGRVVFSAFDLSGALGEVPVYGSVGYTPASARRIIGNVVAASVHKKG